MSTSAPCHVFDRIGAASPGAALKPAPAGLAPALAIAALLWAVCVSRAPAQPFTPPPRPAVAPSIGETYSKDSNANRIEDRLESRASSVEAMSRYAVTPEERRQAQALRDSIVEVELIFRTPIAQSQIDDFLTTGGEITYVYKAVSYGWNGRIPLGKVKALPRLMGGALVQIEEQKPAELHMRLATQTGRVRPVWASGFAGGSGYEGSGDISIAIIDTGVDDSHTDLAGRQAFWKDYTIDNEPAPRDIIQHGTHVTGIALGTGDSLGTGTTLRFTDSGDMTGASTGSFYPSLFDFPEVSTTWNATATWLGGGPAAMLHYAHRVKGVDGGFSSDGSSSGVSPLSRNAVLTLLSANAYTPALLKTATMTTYAVASSLTGFSAVGDGSNTLRGVAPGCQWVGAKVFTNAGGGTDLGIGSAIDDMVVQRATYNIKVMNLSLGIIGAPGISTSLRQKVNTAANNGIVPVISAGNDGTESTAGAREIDDPGRAAMEVPVML